MWGSEVIPYSQLSPLILRSITLLSPLILTVPTTSSISGLDQRAAILVSVTRNSGTMRCQWRDVVCRALTIRFDLLLGGTPRSVVLRAGYVDVRDLQRRNAVRR